MKRVYIITFGTLILFTTALTFFTGWYWVAITYIMWFIAAGSLYVSCSNAGQRQQRELYCAVAMKYGNSANVQRSIYALASIALGAYVGIQGASYLATAWIISDMRVLIAWYKVWAFVKAKRLD